MFTLQSIFKNKNVREVYSTYMKQDSMGTDKWRGFTYTKGPAFSVGSPTKSCPKHQGRRGKQFYTATIWPQYSSGPMRLCPWS